MITYPSKNYRRHVLRFVHMTIAGTLGWLASSYWLHGQDWVSTPTTGPSAVESTPCLDANSTGLAFWQSPSVTTPNTGIRPQITKVPFRYGDFGAVSYPQLHQRSNFYRSRTDWAWDF